MSKGVRVPDDIAQQAADAFTKFGGTRTASKELGIPRSTFRRRLKIAVSRGLLGTKPVLPTWELKKTASHLDSSGQVLSEWVHQGPESGEVFAMPAGQVLKGVSALVDPDGRVKQQWIKTKGYSITPDLVAALREVFAEYSGKAELIAPPEHTDEKLLSIYPIADQHNGLLAWWRETGESYDLKIGMQRLRSCMANLVSQAPPSRNAIILNLGDWQHTDDQRNMTPASGNILDVDSRYFKILHAGVRLMMDCIDLALQKHQSVMVRNMPGNHDPHASIALTIALHAFYHNNNRVTVDDDPSPFFFHRFGSTLIGATHGQNIKPDNMAMAMATTRREDWGATKYHYFYFGHIHKETVKEVGDVRCESFQSLAANDAWAHSKGYVSGKSLTSITIHEDGGEIGRHKINIRLGD